MTENIPRTPEEHREWWAKYTDVPYGFCWCGCGQKTPLSPQTHTKTKSVRGQPKRYAAGSHSQTQKRMTKVMHEQYWAERLPDIPYGMCACGCGAQTPLATCTSVEEGRFRGLPCFYFSGPHARRNKIHPLSNYIEEDRGFDTPCWIWQGSMRGNYGSVYRRNNRGTVSAHRYFYEAAHGNIGQRKFIDHLCRVTACVNPDHLEPVSPAENTRRGNVATLTQAGAQDIRYLWSTGRYSQEWLAHAYMISQGAISQVIIHGTWDY